MMSPFLTDNRAISSSQRCTARFFLLLAVIFYMCAVSQCRSCFECSSLNETYCPEQMIDDDEGIIPYNGCTYIHDARYCVKAVGIIGVTTGGEIFCFVCDETQSQDYGCSSNLLSAPMVSCRDIFDAQYCIKTTNLYAGSLGTRRFCSSRDLGNYCEYIRRPGDQREYRSCVYTCSGDGCNGSMGGPGLPNLWFLVAASVLPFLIYFRDFSSTFTPVFNLPQLRLIRGGAIQR